MVTKVFMLVGAEAMTAAVAGCVGTYQPRSRRHLLWTITHKVYHSRQWRQIVHSIVEGPRGEVEMSCRMDGKVGLDLEGEVV